MQSCYKVQILSASQGTPEWHAVRKSLKVTASKFGAVYLYQKGKCPKEWLQEPTKPNYAMMMGTACESIVRSWFVNSEWWNSNWEMREVGIAIPDFDKRIGSSVDGLILKDGIPIGIIEIKCPIKIYDSLTTKGVPENKRIPFTHYAQMQGGMAILNVDFCFYIVYGHGRYEDGTQEEHKMYVQKIFRDVFFWEKKLYPTLCEYIHALPTNGSQ